MINVLANNHAYLTSFLNVDAGNSAGKHWHQCVWWVRSLPDRRICSLVGTSESRANMMLLCIQTDIVLGKPVRKLSLAQQGRPGSSGKRNSALLWNCSQELPLHLFAVVICWYSFFEAKEIKKSRKHQQGATSALIWQHVIQQSSAKNKKKRVKQAKGSTWYFLMPEPEPEPSQQHGRCEGMEMEGHAGTNGMSWLNQTQTQPSALEGING